MRYLWLAAVLLLGPGAFGDEPLGAGLYRDNCVECHGPAGAGDGPKAAFIEQSLPDLRGTAYKTADADVFKTISDGVPGSPMKGFAGKLTDEQMHALVAYLKDLRQLKAR